MVLRLILGDQLSRQISSLSDIDKVKDTILLCEVWDEATYVRHHKKKIAFLFSAMRHFAQGLREEGYTVEYTHLDCPDNTGSLFGEVARIAENIDCDQVVVTEASEYRLLRKMRQWEKKLNVLVEIRRDDRFLCSKEEFASWAKGRKQLRMEYFYREMRRKYSILMDGDQPEGGQWNYDSENRKPPKEGLNIPETYISKPDEVTRDVIKLVSDKFSTHFGDVEPFYFAVKREQALQALEKFVQERLVYFGDFQDAMLTSQPWMFHSHLSFYLNCGLLEPLECIQAAQEAYYTGCAPLNAVEGFIRQIIGWREYIRGIYWLKMPDYAEVNFLSAEHPLPQLYWDAVTQMNCLRQCVTETQKNAYAHHIQRLMVLGNFALIAGISPQQMNEWYLIVYADAYEWVELPNVSGMILFADGGLLGSKPYAASGAYINKMSDYCKACRYKVREKNGPEACPFNYLYWDFINRNKDKLQKNPRLGMVYRTFDKMAADKKEAIQADSHLFLKKLYLNEKV